MRLTTAVWVGLITKATRKFIYDRLPSLLSVWVWFYAGSRICSIDKLWEFHNDHIQGLLWMSGSTSCWIYISGTRFADLVLDKEYAIREVNLLTADKRYHRLGFIQKHIIP